MQWSSSMQPIYIVLLVVLIVWTGVFGYMFYLNREIKKLKEKMKL
jgi:CcmD family protein